MKSNSSQYLHDLIPEASQDKKKPSSEYLIVSIKKNNQVLHLRSNVCSSCAYKLKLSADHAHVGQEPIHVRHRQV